MKLELGVVGAFVFAFGGAILFEGLYQLFNINNYGASEFGLAFIGFIGFLFAGLGLLLIVQSGKPEVERQKEKEVIRLRIDDYRFYGQICLGFGIILSLLGIFDSALAGTLTYFRGGIFLVIVGFILIGISQILFRKYRFRSTEQPPSPPKPPPQV